MGSNFTCCAHNQGGGGGVLILTAHTATRLWKTFALTLFYICMNFNPHKYTDFTMHRLIENINRSVNILPEAKEKKNNVISVFTISFHSSERFGS